MVSVRGEKRVRTNEMGATKGMEKEIRRKRKRAGGKKKGGGSKERKGGKWGSKGEWRGR